MCYNGRDGFLTHIPALALSVERTRILVDQSIELYLLQRSRYRLSQVQSFQQHRYGPQPEESSIATPFLYELNARDTDPASNIDAHRTLDSAIPVRKASPWDEVNLSGIRDSTYDIATVSDGPPTRTPPRPPSDTGTYAQRDPAADSDDSKKIFGRLESYLITCLNDCECLNAAFGSTRPTQPSRATSEASVVAERPKRSHASDIPDQPLFEVDAKTLLLGDIGENGMWWTGDRRISDKKAHRNFVASASSDRRGLRFDWSSIEQWYASIMMCGTTWKSHLQCLSTEELSVLTSEEERYIEARFAEARRHVHRTFVKAVENLLRRPSRPLKSPSDCRFLVILLLNPLLYGHHGHTASSASSSLLAVQTAPLEHNHNCGTSTLPVARPNPFGGATGQHSGIVKRLLGLMANLPAECHRSIVSWLCRLPEPHFKDIVELVGGFVSYRLGKQSGRTWDTNHDPIAGLIPSIAGPGAGTSAYLHAALSTNRRSTQREAKDKPRPVVYANDWQIRVAARVMSLLFTANNSGKHISSDNSRSTGAISSYTVHSAARRRAHRHSQILPTSTFYNTLLDNADLVSDFEKWETRQGKFSFCQYPMFLSIRAKIRIMEHDAHRQMEIKARDAFFTSILSRKAVNQYLVLKVRRDCLVDDSLRNVSEVVGTGQEEIKKGLRIEFVGEEGIDAGG
jgi:E3 ubiquitin-protein ligase HECTD2